MKSEYLFQMSFPTSIPQLIEFKEWKESLGFCSPFMYKALLADDTDMPSFIKFHSNIKQFKIEQSNEMKPGILLIKLVGILEKYFIMSSVFFKINV
jgi:hypothetical protein